MTIRNNLYIYSNQNSGPQHIVVLTDVPNEVKASLIFNVLFNSIQMIVL